MGDTTDLGCLYSCVGNSYSRRDVTTILADGESLSWKHQLGSSWEGFALDCVWRSIGKSDEQVYFWATHSGAAVDLFWQHDGKQWACKFKYTDAPTLTKSMCSALTTLDLEKLWVVYPGNTRYQIHEKVEVLPLKQVSGYWEY